MRDALYYGCKSTPGHYVFTADAQLADRHIACDWLRYLDGKLAPKSEGQVEGLARLHHFTDCTLIAFWDRSVDGRLGSNSIFALPGQLTFAQAIKQAKQEFPWVFARFKFDVVSEGAR